MADFIVLLRDPICAMSIGQLKASQQTLAELLTASFQIAESDGTGS